MAVIIGAALAFAAIGTASATSESEFEDAFDGVTGSNDFQTACAGIDGAVYAGPGNPSTCTLIVGGGTDIVPGGSQGWTVEVTTAPTTHVATWTGGSNVAFSHTGGGSTVTGCWNPGQQAMSLNHQHCQPAQ